MKFFLDSAKLDEIKYAYNTFGIDGVTTNPRHIMVSGKPFMTAITDIAEWIKAEGIEGVDKFPVSVEINPHLDDADAMVEMAVLHHMPSFTSSKVLTVVRFFSRMSSFSRRKKIVATSARLVLFSGRTVPSA